MGASNLLTQCSHAGYSYSGPCAAWAYKSLDLSKAKRIFLLGPSHTYYLSGCALTTFAKYETPFGDFTIDGETTAELRATGKFKNMPPGNDVAEHSLEMHLPYIWKRCEQTFGAGKPFPPLVPILVGDGSGREEKEFAKVLLPYLQDPETAFVVSSDFCHWGKNFRYRVYAPGTDLSEMDTLSSSGPAQGEPPVHEFIRILDEAAFAAIETGVHDNFVDYLKLTENTVCGRHPIGVTMAALEMLAAEKGGSSSETKGEGKFTFVQYQRSNLVKRASDTSVSYAAAYAIV
jgi:MEMO1 family protein